jgi:hypothetical protein
MIGIIVKTDREVEELNQDWVPSAFNASELSAAFEEVLGYVPSIEEFCHKKGETLIYFTVDDLSEPKAITFNCTMVSAQAEIIKSITKMLGAKIYDSESGSFVEAENI